MRWWWPAAVFIVQFTNAVERNFDARLETLLLTLITATNDKGEVDETAVEGSSGGSFSAPALRLVLADRATRGTGRAIDWSESLQLRHPADRGHADRGRSLAHPDLRGERRARSCARSSSS